MREGSERRERLSGGVILAALLSSALPLLLGGCYRPVHAPSGSPASGVPRSAVPTASEPTPTVPLAGKVGPPKSGAYLGVYSPPTPFGSGHLQEFESYVRRDVSIVMWYQPWAADNRSSFDAGAVVSIWRQGKIPMITWEPWDPGSNANRLENPTGQPRYSLGLIVSGKFDKYIRSWARDIRNAGGPVMLRPMHEMNGFWYPWCGTVNGNRPAQFIAAWRHIHDIFAEEGATNVTWVWSINHESVPMTAANSYGVYYPGDAYVDWTAISGFNFGTTSPYSSWSSFKRRYDKPLAYLYTLRKPICLAEFGCVEQGGNKSDWISDAYAQIRKMPRVKAVVYYDSAEDGGKWRQDWRVATSVGSARAFRKAVSSPYFISTSPTELTDWVGTLSQRQWQYLASILPLY